MSAASRYIGFQTLGPFLFFTLVFTGVIWLSQALQLLDVIFDRHQASLTFLRLTLLSLPTVLSLSLPVALLAGMLYTLHRLHMDRELTVMASAGVSSWGVARPLLFLTGIVALFVLALTLLIAPASMRQIKDDIQSLRTDVTANLLREGTFATPIEGLTVYVRRRKPGGGAEGILVHDSRNKETPVTYMAESGVLINTSRGPRLVMVNGSIQQLARKGSSLTMLHFDRYNFDLSQFTQKQRMTREPSERFLNELFFQRPDDEWSQRMKHELAAEAHSRLSAPFYPFAYTLIAIAAMMGGRFSRRGYGWRILGAVLAALILRLSGYGIQSRAEILPQLNIFLYILPILFMVTAVGVINHWHRPSLKSLRRANSTSPL